jgi:hypothetical protein
MLFNDGVPTAVVILLSVRRDVRNREQVRILEDMTVSIFDGAAEESHQTLSYDTNGSRTSVMGVIVLLCITR